MVRLSNYFELDSKKKKKINPIIRQPPFPGCMEVVVLFFLLCVLETCQTLIDYKPGEVTVTLVNFL